VNAIGIRAKIPDGMIGIEESRGDEDIIYAFKHRGETIRKNKKRGRAV